MNAGARGKAVFGIDRASFYRQVRAFHGYLSALSFILLMAFSATGILLNHPAWFAGPRPAADERTIPFAKSEVAQALRMPDPPAALAALVSARTQLRGGFRSGEILGGEARLRFEGVTGTSDAVIDLETGTAEISVERAGVVQALNDLHRGKNAGTAWSLVIDLGAALILAMSVLGYVIFFSLRFRLRTSLLLTAASLALLAGIFVALVP